MSSGASHQNQFSIPTQLEISVPGRNRLSNYEQAYTLPSDAPPLSDFAENILSALRKEMPFFQNTEGYPTYLELLDDVLPSIRRVQQAVVEFRTFLEKLAETNIAIEQSGFEHEDLRRQAFRSACREWVEESQSWEALPYPKISAEREASTHLEQHEAHYQNELEHLLEKFAVNIERKLDRLIALEMIGLVKWGTETSCDFHFFNTVILQEVEQRSTIKRQLYSRVMHVSDWSTKRVTAVEQRHRIRGKSEHRHARSDIYLREATQRPVELVEHRIPDQFAELSRSIPSWLRPMATCIEGMRCAEEIVVATIGEEAFDVQDGQPEVLYHTTYEIRPEYHTRQYRAHCDPALVLDDYYVLCGWGPKEEESHASEKAKKRAESVRAQRLAHLRSQGDMARYGGIVLALLGLLLVLFFRMQPSVMLSMSSLAAIVSLAVFGFSFRADALLRGDEDIGKVLLRLGMTGVAIAGTYFLALGLMASLPVMIGVGALAWGALCPTVAVLVRGKRNREQGEAADGR